MGEILYLFLISLLASVLGLVGGLVFLYKKTWENFLSRFATSFAAGVLMFVSLQNLVPKSLHYLGNVAYFYVLFFLVLIFFTKVLLNKIHEKSHTARIKGQIFFLVFGDSIHNFLDGVAIGTSFVINPVLGFFAALSAFAHEVPHEIADFGVMLKAGMRKQNIIIVNLLSSATAIIGAFLAYYLSGIDPFAVGIFMSISAGVFLYLAIFEFMPNFFQIRKHGVKILLPFLVGVVLMFAINQTLPHEHDEVYEGDALEQHQN
ncbi:MAG: ZIP family metal transporter [Patescibacteria group bacterium]|nr:ZIP family metal transporter [Patescibacteria group bacterium]